jgi:hypothetical protein
MVLRNFLVAFLLLIAKISMGQVSLDQGLVAYFPFNGNANDESGNNNNAKFRNGVKLSSDRFGDSYSAVSMDGVNDFIEIKNNGSLSLRSKFSFAIQFMTNDLSKIQTLLARRDRYDQSKAQFQVFINWHKEPGVGMGQHFSNNSACETVIHKYNAYSSTGTNTVSLNVWHCVVGTFDGKYQRIYLDGKLLDSLATPFSKSDSCGSLPLLIGMHTYLDPQGFVGKIDEVRFYSRVLNSQEVLALCDPNDTRYYTRGKDKSASPFLRKVFWEGLATANHFAKRIFSSRDVFSINHLPLMITGISAMLTIYSAILTPF